jgi:release factor glutamine methyltransferase
LSLTLAQAIATATHDLKQVSETPRLDSELLLMAVTGLSRVGLMVNQTQILSQTQAKRWQSLVMRRLQHEPVAYILGEKEFFGHTFHVNSQVLIPRPDTELLVERAIAHIAERSMRVLDIGVGSGCVGLSILKACPNATLVGWDVSPQALAVAQKNAESLGIVKNRYQWCLQDALQEEAWCEADKFSIIVSNPPYIAEAERKDLARSVKDFEPSLALFATHEGLAFYEAIARWASKVLMPQGVVAVEIGWMQAQAVAEIFAKASFVEGVVHHDLEGRPRVWEGSIA